MFYHDLCLKGIMLKLDECKLEAISYGPFEKWDYYNHNNTIAIIKKAIDNKIDYPLILKWAKLLGNCMTFYPNYFNSYKKLVYNNIANYLLEITYKLAFDKACLFLLAKNITNQYNKYKLFEKYSLDYIDEHEKIYISS